LKEFVMISQKYPLIAAAVAATLAVGVANAAVPTLGAAAAPVASLVIAGSSAAESSVQAAVGADICGGAANMLTMKSAGGSGNFFAFSCTPSPAISGVPAGVVTIYYRTEGGSVVGALPVVSEAKIKRLNLSDASCTASGTSGTCSITGLTATAGTQDSWGGAAVADFVQLGVTDVEPGQLGNPGDFPSAYNPAVFGTATAKQLAGLPTSRIFQQVFGIVVNTTGGAFTAGGVNLSKESVQNILLRNYTDWHNVPNATTGQPLTSASQTITPIDREQGSGTRTATNIFFLNYGCGGSTAIDSTGETLNFSTTDELNAAENTAGAIAYTSIDQILKAPTAFPNLVLASINGVSPTNLAAATGAYDYWYEATFVTNTAQLTGASLQIATVLENKLPVLANAPGTPDVNVIPNFKGNNPAVPIPSTGTGTTQIYINPFTRGGNSCSIPAEQN
jgi:periplasmic binding family protein